MQTMLEKNHKKLHSFVFTSLTPNSQIVLNRDGCVGCCILRRCPQLWLGCQWDIWGTGWGRQEGLGVVIKLPLFPPGSLLRSDSALIGLRVPWQPGTLSARQTPGEKGGKGSFIIFNLWQYITFKLIFCTATTACIMWHVAVEAAPTSDSYYCGSSVKTHIDLKTRFHDARCFQSTKLHC